jgi:glycosyltransferase involved in cell wall biosynthesis
LKIAIVYITKDRLFYVDKSLPAMLDNAGIDFDLYVIDNGSHDGTLEYVSEYKDSRIKKVIRNSVNLGQRIPINWFWKNCQADLLGKFDDDIIPPQGWLKEMSDIFKPKSNGIGTVGGCAFHPADFESAHYEHNILKIGDRQMLRQYHVGGYCYLVPKSVVDKYGPIRNNFTTFQHRIHRSGLKNGYAYPFIKMTNMEDPRFGMRHPSRPVPSDSNAWVANNISLLSEMVSD